MRCPTRPAARPRRWPDARMCGGEVSLAPISLPALLDHVVKQLEVLRDAVLPNTQAWVAGFGNCKRHPSFCSRALSNAVSAEWGIILKSSSADVLMCHPTEGSTIL